jgi:hypothetical protein
MADPQLPESLTSYIQRNDKMLTTLGVMIALTVFAQGMPNRVAGAILASMFILGAILVFAELVTAFRWGRPRSIRLITFEGLLLTAMILLTLAWMIDVKHTLGQNVVNVIVCTFTSSTFLVAVKRFATWLEAKRPGAAVPFIMLSLIAVCWGSWVFLGPRVGRALYTVDPYKSTSPAPQP